MNLKILLLVSTVLVQMKKNYYQGVSSARGKILTSTKVSPTGRMLALVLGEQLLKSLVNPCKIIEIGDTRHQNIMLMQLKHPLFHKRMLERCLAMFTVKKRS